jgi:hypothetical protein
MIVLCLFIDLQYKSSDNPSILTNPVGNTMVDAVFNGLSGNDLTVFLKVTVSFSKFFHCPVFECALIIKNELFPIIPCEKSKCNICHLFNLLQQKRPGSKRLFKPIVPSSLDILSNRRPAKLSLYDPLRCGVLSSDDLYSYVHIISSSNLSPPNL